MPSLYPYFECFSEGSVTGSVNTVCKTALMGTRKDDYISLQEDQRSRPS